MFAASIAHLMAMFETRQQTGFEERGFPYADFADCGAAIAAFGDTQDMADRAADALLSEVNGREPTFLQHTMPSIQAVAEARRLSVNAKGPIVLADTQDKPGGGGHARDGAAQAAVSAGNTGALMAISRYLLKTLDGIDRPAIATQLPNASGGATTVLDLGANVDCTAEHLLQFAVMGSALVSALSGRDNPSVCLLYTSPSPRDS